jgi:hypothetical protein
MEFLTTPFRHADLILTSPRFVSYYDDIVNAIEGISDDDLVERHELLMNRLERPPKSLSKAINELLKERFEGLGWSSEPHIFKKRGYTGDKWRLDFAKEAISVEVAFNHGEATAWNLLKPVLASEPNYISKEIRTEIGVFIAATQQLKKAGGFDGAIGTYEKALKYLEPLRSVLSAPILLIGLKPPRTFEIKHKKVQGKNVGLIHRFG